MVRGGFVICLRSQNWSRFTQASDSPARDYSQNVSFSRWYLSLYYFHCCVMFKDDINTHIYMQRCILNIMYADAYGLHTTCAVL